MSARCPNCDTPVYGCIDVSQLSERHIKALELFTEKYIRGALEHGDLAAGKKWTKDQLDEMVDFAFYIVFELLEHL